jgi:hypothetical protein
MKYVLGLIVAVCLMGADVSFAQCAGGSCSAGPRVSRARSFAKVREVKVVRKAIRR